MDMSVSPSAAPADPSAQWYDVAVIGGGVIGHGIAWEARRSGRSVALIDDAPGSGASWAAAGMLAPVSELHYQEEGLLALMLEAARLWPGLAVKPLTVREARAREPLLSPGISCAFDIPADHQVDPRRLLARIDTLLAADGRFTAVTRRAAGLLWDGGRVAGVGLEGGGELRAGETIVANGLGAAELQGLPEGLALPLRPVYGD